MRSGMSKRREEELGCEQREQGLEMRSSRRRRRRRRGEIKREKGGRSRSW